MLVHILALSMHVYFKKYVFIVIMPQSFVCVYFSLIENRCGSDRLECKLKKFLNYQS